ncbi:MAG: hypothetical protein AAGN35_11835 [Bacteroidota bacterium]
MKRPKLYTQLATLSRKDLRRFGEFVASPYYTRHEETQTFFATLRKHHPAFAISDEKLFAQAFPRRPYDNSRLRVLRTYVLELLHRFWVVEELELDAKMKLRMKIRGLGRQGLAEEQRKEIVKAKAPLDDKPLGSMPGAYHAYNLAESLVDSNMRMEKRSAAADVQAMLRRLDEFALGNRLKVLCAVWNQRANYSFERGDLGLEETLNLVERLHLDQQPLIGLYFHLLQLLNDGDHEVHFPALRKLLRSNQGLVESDELVNIFGFLINYCLHANNQGRREFLRVAFETYQEMIALDLLFGQGTFSANSYKNILALGARLKEFTWTRGFLEENYLRLPERWRDGVFHYGHAYLDFAEGKYRDAKRHLLEVEFYDQLYRSSHQALLLRIYYETDEVEPFFALVETFRRYLNRNNDLSAVMITALQNQVTLTKRIFEFKIGEREATVDGLRAEIASMKPMVDAGWLLEKLAEM